MKSDEEEVLAIILASYIFKSNKNKLYKKKRSVWTKKWVERRAQDGFSTKLYRELRAEEPNLYHNFVRMTSDQFDHLLLLLSPHIKKNDTTMRKSISASDRLMLTLRYLATGDSFHSLQYLFRIPHNTISSIIPEVLDALYKVLVSEYLQLPTTPEAWQKIASDFDELWQFPNCIGAVDGKHVTMIAPAHAGSTFYNYKGTHSIVLMAIADANYKLIYVDVGRNGKFADGGVFNRCTFSQAMEKNQLGLPPPKPLPGRVLPMPYTLVADDAFALRPNIMKPYSQRGLTMVKRIYNYRLSRARRIIENVFGIMAVRFRVLLKPIHLNEEKTKKVVLACCVLHNYLMSTNKNKYVSRAMFDRYNEPGELLPGTWRKEYSPNSTMFPLESALCSANLPSAKEVQEELTSYFVGEGELPWQYKHI